MSARRLPAFALLVLALLVGATAATAQAGRADEGLGGAVGIRIADGQLTVGDTTEAEITLVWEGDEIVGQPIFPAWQGVWGEAEVLTVGAVEPKSEGPRRVFRQTLKIAAFRPGTLELPHIVVQVPLAGRQVEVRSKAPARLVVGSVLPGEKSPEGQNLEQKAAAGLVGLELSPWPFRATIALLALIDLVLAWRLAQAVGRQRTAPTKAPLDALVALPPFEEFLRRLEALDLGRPERAYTGISFAIRQFLSRTFEFQALESTTTEIQRRLRNFLPVSLGQELVVLLRDCDRVKFGNLAAGNQAATPLALADHVAKARSLGQQVVDRVRPAERKAS